MSDGFAPSLQRAATAGVFVFFSAMFAIPTGYSYGGAILLLAGLWMLAGRTLPVLERPDRVMIAAMLSYGVIHVVMALCLGNSHSDVDRASRALLIVPVFLLLLRVSIRLWWMWAGIVIGVVLSAVMAWRETVLLGLDRAAGFQDAIHFSNVALVFAAFCTAGLLWAGTQGHRSGWWRATFLAGLVCGLYSAVAGGSRGSWLALPAVFAVFAAALLNRRNWMHAVWILAACTAALAAVFAMPDSKLRQRYQAGVYDMQQYAQNNPDTSIGARLEMWRGALLNLQKRPFRGWNHDDYNRALEPDVRAGRVSELALEFPGNLHNNYLQAWAYAGLPGLLALLALYGVPLWYFGRYLRDRNPTVQALALCGAALCASYWCFSLTHVILGRNNTIMFFLLALSILWSALRHARVAHRQDVATSARCRTARANTGSPPPATRACR